MARPLKNGLDYFPFDVDFFADEKIICLMAEHGNNGWIVALHLLIAIYRNGYWLRWTEAQRCKLLYQNRDLTADKLDAIMESLMKWEFFDRELFEREGVLTSRGIQRRYFAIARRRKGDERPYLLIEQEPKKSEKPAEPAKIEEPEEQKEPVKPSEAEVTEYFERQQGDRRLDDPEGAARLFYDSFAATGWRNKHGQPVINWRSEANKWIFYQKKREQTPNLKKHDISDQPIYRNGRAVNENMWIHGKIVPACGIFEE